MALNVMFPWSDPAWLKIALAGLAGGIVGQLKQQTPQVITKLPLRFRAHRPLRRDVGSHGMALVPVDSALALFEVNRVAR